jgi:hypothetical protein
MGKRDGLMSILNIRKKTGNVPNAENRRYYTANGKAGYGGIRTAVNTGRFYIAGCQGANVPNTE